MKALVFYKVVDGKKVKVYAQAVQGVQGLEMEVVDVSNDCDVSKLDYDEEGVIVEDIEKTSMAKRIVDLELQSLMGGI